MNKIIDHDDAQRLALIKQEESNLARCYLDLREEASRWYLADGTFEVLYPAEVIRRKKDAAVKLAEREGLAAKVEELQRQIAPGNSLNLGEYLGPVKPCPFCGSVALSRPGFEEDIVCDNCGASCSVGGWQFRDPAHDREVLEAAWERVENLGPFQKTFAGASQYNRIKFAILGTPQGGE